MAIAIRHNPTRVEGPHSAGPAVATEIVPRTKPRGIRTPRRAAWGSPATLLFDVAIAIASTAVGWMALNLLDRIIFGLFVAGVLK